MLDVEVIDEPDRARALLDPLRARVLTALSTPGSATTVAEALGETRQKVNYHLRALENHGLVERCGDRPRRGLTERLFVASADSYVLSPAVLGDHAADPTTTDRLSARYLVAVASRMIREVAELARRADEREAPVESLTIDADICFATAADRAAFTDELAESVRRLAARFHDENAERGRWHRLVVAAHPTPASTPSEEEITHE